MSDHDQPVAANLLDRCFEAPGPNQRWVGDTTEFVIAAAASFIWPWSSTYSRGSSWAGP